MKLLAYKIPNEPALTNRGQLINILSWSYKDINATFMPMKSPQNIECDLHSITCKILFTARMLVPLLAANTIQILSNYTGNNSRHYQDRALLVLMSWNCIIWLHTPILQAFPCESHRLFSFFASEVSIDLLTQWTVGHVRATCNGS